MDVIEVISSPTISGTSARPEPVGLRPLDDLEEEREKDDGAEQREPDDQAGRRCTR